MSKMDPSWTRFGDESKVSSVEECKASLLDFDGHWLLFFSIFLFTPLRAGFFMLPSVSLVVMNRRTVRQGHTYISQGPSLRSFTPETQTLTVEEK